MERRSLWKRMTQWLLINCRSWLKPAAHSACSTTVCRKRGERGSRTLNNNKADKGRLEWNAQDLEGWSTHGVNLKMRKDVLKITCGDADAEIQNESVQVNTVIQVCWRHMDVFVGFWKNNLQPNNHWTLEQGFTWIVFPLVLLSCGSLPRQNLCHHANIRREKMKCSSMFKRVVLWWSLPCPEQCSAFVQWLRKRTRWVYWSIFQEKERQAR